MTTVHASARPDLRPPGWVMLLLSFTLGCSSSAAPGASAGGAGGADGGGGSSGESGSGGTGGAAGGGGAGPAPGHSVARAPSLQPSSAGWGAAVVYPDFTLENYPAVDGSTSTLPLARVIACGILGIGHRWQPYLGPEGISEIIPAPTSPDEQALADGILAKIVHSQTHQAYVNLIDGVADLILVANPPSPDELAEAAAEGVSFDLRAVAEDALVILTHESNAVSSLTPEQIRRIYLGDITRWDQVGGAPGEIHPYARPENSGSQQLFNAIVMQGQPLPPWPPDREPTHMGAAIDLISTDALSIGYSVYYYVNFQYPPSGMTGDGRGFRTLQVSGVPPTASTIASGSYPFVAPVWVVVRQDLAPDSGAAVLRDWLLTRDGQYVVARSGYVTSDPPW